MGGSIMLTLLKAYLLWKLLEFLLGVLGVFAFIAFIVWLGKR
jgi:hypothetical protein